MLCPNECKRLQFQTLVELIINECTEKKNHNAPIYAPISISQHSRELNKRWTQEIWNLIVWYFQPSKTSVYSVHAGYMCRQQASVYRLRVRGWTECQVLHRQQLRIPHVATEGQNSKALHIKHAILQFIYAANNNKPAILHLDPLLVMSKNIILHLYCACSNLR